jgi:hypothetical protein
MAFGALSARSPAKLMKHAPIPFNERVVVVVMQSLGQMIGP